MGDFVKSFSRGQLVQSVLLAWFLPIAGAMAAILFAFDDRLRSSRAKDVLDSAKRWSGLNALVLFVVASLIVAALCSLSFPVVSRLLRTGHAGVLLGRWTSRLIRNQCDWLELLTAEERLQLARFENEAARQEWLSQSAAARSRLRRRRRPGITAKVPMRTRPLLGLRELRDYPPISMAHLRELREITDAKTLLARSRVAPTGIGNLMRRGQRVGAELFGIDAYALWYEIRSHLSSSLVEESRTVREDVEFSAAFWCAGAFMSVAGGCVAAASMLDSNGIDVPGGAILLIGLAVASAARRRLVGAVRESNAVLQAMVVTTRAAVARDFGLELPPELHVERKLWRTVLGTVQTPKKEWREQFSVTRKVHPARPKSEGAEASLPAVATDE